MYHASNRVKSDKNALSLLVNSQHGVYNYHVLANNYIDNLHVYLGDDKYQLLSEFIRSNIEYNDETIETIFNPDNEENWLANLEHIEFAYPLHILNDDDKKYYEVYCHEGDILAIHPDAVYCESEDTYKFEVNNV